MASRLTRSIRGEGHGEAMLKGIMHLRKIVRAELVGSTLDSFWVADPVGSLLDSDLLRPVTSTELSHYLGGDNVHYTPVGYTKIVSGLVNSFECVRKKMENAALSASVSGSGRDSRRFFWRGFTSAHGAPRTGSKLTATAATATNSHRKWQ